MTGNDTEPIITPDSEESPLFEHYRFTVDKGQEPLRMDKYLQMRMGGVSRTKIQAAAKASCILVNDKATKSNYKIKPLDVISILLPTPPNDTEVIPEDIPFNIVYEDHDLLVVNKDAGMVVHPGYANFTGTLLNAITFYLQPATPYLVHRIDKDTSGLLVIAKTEDAQAGLAKQFFYHTIERKYYALVWGDFDKDDGTIVGNLARSQKDRRIMAVYDNPDIGKHAITHWHVVERFGYVTLVECVLETGRTHQIRVHMKHIGHPLFNDAMYGGNQILKGTTFSKYKQFIENCFQTLSRQALHAAILGFEHPMTHQQMHFELPMPDDMTTVINKWRSYAQSAQKDTP